MVKGPNVPSLQEYSLLRKPQSYGVGTDAAAGRTGVPAAGAGRGMPAAA